MFVWNTGKKMGQQSYQTGKRFRAFGGGMGYGRMKSIFVSLLVTVLIGGIYFYFQLPTLHIQSMDLYGFILLLCFCYSFSRIMTGGNRHSGRTFLEELKHQAKIPSGVVILCATVIAGGSLAGWVVIRASAYASLLKTNTGDFSQDINEISFDQIPMLDSDSANALANRKLGELSELVSQFTVSDTSAQINYQGKPVRVTYLNYESFFKWIGNRSKGIPAYMMVDMITQDVSVVRNQEGMKYSPSEYFHRNLKRHLRFQYPTKMFDDVNFEVDEEGTPFWVASVLTKRIGLFGGEDVKGAVLLNANTGESKYYDLKDVPTWVDRVFSADLITRQYNYHGMFHKGFFNSVFGQSGCTKVTDGYNYIAQDDDVWLYTGITSISEDRGNIGFILVNQRTKESKYYSCAGAEEKSAMSSAEGAVQQYQYRSTFPLLLNISDQPTYFMALKDEAGLVKMYAMVNVQQYQIVATGNNVENCKNSYTQQLIGNRIVSDQDGEDVSTETEKNRSKKSVEGVITDIRQVNIEGNTHLFFRLDQGDTYYVVNASRQKEAILLNIGEKVEIRFVPSEDSLILESEIEKKE